MEKLLLREQDIYPNNNVLQTLLGDVFNAYQELEALLTSYDLILNWNYYKDGKTYLCKVTYKKKTVFWLSIWETYIKIGFYFNEKTSLGIYNLDIDQSIITSYDSTKHVGKFRQLIFEIRDNSQFDDLTKIITYKMSLK
ncbi:MAG: DUF3788 family protein [Bacteroidales bacterium]|jgi:hypothetical protein